eukprot:TRINITY_DN14162_c0_g1_i2.p2 TRINITY_DN14162_c0_g1~~TRINITY_DN14162_c0_g1_i2.p2  ORF type:complete len:165 (-),score=18.55 TRINITY_DN14162_c0_g1_i2:169-663(-)
MCIRDSINAEYMGRESFKLRNRFDMYQDYSEFVEISGFTEYNLVRVGDYKPCCFGLGWFILFTFLTMVEFYKMHLDSYCILQKFSVSKVVSSRQDINSAQFVQEYQPQIPCIVYMGKSTFYDAVPEMPHMTPPPPAPSSPPPIPNYEGYQPPAPQYQSPQYNQT